VFVENTDGSYRRHPRKIHVPRCGNALASRHDNEGFAACRRWVPLVWSGTSPLRSRTLETRSASRYGRSPQPAPPAWRETLGCSGTAPRVVRGRIALRLPTMIATLERVAVEVVQGHECRPSDLGCRCGPPVPVCAGVGGSRTAGMDQRGCAGRTDQPPA